MASAQDSRTASNGALPDLSGLAGRTPADRAAAGRAARAAVPRRSHARFHPSAARPDPVALLTQQDAGRIADLLPIRFGRMLASPFAFLRGAALIMASDLSGTPVTGLYVQACGDAHLSNFGVYASPERRLVFEVNDFDETLPAPWEWDVKRLATSIEVAGRGNGFSRGQRRANVLAAVARYRSAMLGFAGRPELGIWYAPSELDELRRQYRDVLNRPERKLAQADLAKIRDRDGRQALSELTHVVQGQPRFVSKPPLLVPVADLPGSPGPGTSRPGIDGILARYRATLAPDRRHLVSRFTVADAARKVVGVGSVGMGCWIILLTGRDPSDLLVLQVKQATTSVLSAFAGPTVYHSKGKRVVSGQQLMQEASDIFLGWHSPGRARRGRRGLLHPPVARLEVLAGRRVHAAARDAQLRRAVRADPGPGARPLRGQHRDRGLPRRLGRLRPGGGRLRGCLRRPERPRPRQPGSRGHRGPGDGRARRLSAPAHVTVMASSFAPRYSCATTGGKLARPIGAGSDSMTASGLVS